MQTAGRFLALTSAFAIGLGTAAHVQAQAVSGPAGEVAAIRAAASAYSAAVRAGDLESIRKAWTPEGDYIDSAGQKVKTHELVRQSTAAAPNQESAAIPAAESSLRFITRDVAIEDGTTDCGFSPDGSAMTGHFTAVWVKRDGRWLIDGLRETVSAASPLSDQLQPLEWLLGEWVGTTENAAILSSSRWSDDGHYIVRDFLIRRDGQDDITATQRIGWDPSTNTIRCWTFDSQGSSGEGVWRREGERWLVDTTEILADGKKSKTSAVYVLDANGKFTLEIASAWDAADAKQAAPKLPALRLQFQRARDDL